MVAKTRSIFVLLNQKVLSRFSVVLYYVDWMQEKNNNIITEILDDYFITFKYTIVNTGIKPKKAEIYRAPNLPRHTIVFVL